MGSLGKAGSTAKYCAMVMVAVLGHVHSAHGQVVFRHKLMPDDSHAGAGFGRSIATNDEVALIASVGDNDFGERSGAVYVYDLGKWERIHKLHADDAGMEGEFGVSIAANADHALIGAIPRPGGGIVVGPGSVYVFDLHTGEQVNKLLPEDGGPGDKFGETVAIHGNFALVGAVWDDDNGYQSGSAYLFDLQTGAQLHKLLPEDGAANALFGVSVAITDSVAIVGALGDEHTDDIIGSAYVFDLATGQQLRKVYPDEPPAGTQFGRSLAISDNILAVTAADDPNVAGNAAALYFFDIATGEELDKLMPERGSTTFVSTSFGRSMDFEGNTIVVGSPTATTFGINAGAASIFDSGTGREWARLYPENLAAFDFFGASVAVTGNTILVGREGDDQNGSYSGSAYVYVRLPLGDLDVNGLLDAFDADEFELALAEPDAYSAAYPGVDVSILGDINGDGVLDAFDVVHFEALLANGGAGVPEPGVLALLMGAGVLVAGAGRRSRADGWMLLHLTK